MVVSEIVGFRLHQCTLRKAIKTLYYRPRFRGVNTSLAMLMLKGAAHLGLGSSRLKARAGELVCIDNASLKSARGDPGSAPTYFLAAFDLLDSTGKPAEVSSLGIPACFPLKDLSPVRALLTQMTNIQNSPLDNANLGLTFLKSIFLQAPKEKVFGDRDPFLDVDPRIANVLEYIRDQFKKTFSIDHLARKAFMHPVYFSRRFKRSTGMAPHQYMLHLKIEKAKDGFVRDNNALLTTSNDLGFTDYSHFYRTFKKIAGITPSAFRRLHRNAGDQ